MFGNEQTQGDNRHKTSEHYLNDRMRQMRTHINPNANALRRTSFSLTALAVSVMLAAGCSGESKPAATQIVARINNDEISVHQVNNAMPMMPQATPETMAVARRGVLDKLVNQQLAVQQAIDLKLDRSPEVMMQVDASRREILARSYVNHLVASMPSPSPEEARKFYDAHPELFAQRRIYVLQEISLRNPPPPITELRKLAADKSMADIAIELKQKDIAFTGSSGTRVAEQIALPVLMEIAKLQDGHTGVIETPDLTAIIHVQASKLVPANEAMALQTIPKYLKNEQAKAAIKVNLESLKSKAKIDYLNEFASGAPNAGTQVSATAATPAEEPEAAAISIEKGIAGIK